MLRRREFTAHSVVGTVCIERPAVVYAHASGFTLREDVCQVGYARIWCPAHAIKVKFNYDKDASGAVEKQLPKPNRVAASQHNVYKTTAIIG